MGSIEVKLTEEEREILESVERDERKEIPDFEVEKRRIAEAARATLLKGDGRLGG